MPASSSDVHALCAAFIASVAVRKGRVRLLPFQRDAWFQCAYSSIQRSMAEELPAQARHALQDDLFQAIDGLRDTPPTADGFDAWVVRTIKRQSERYQLSVGQAQQLTNLLLQYYYCFSAAGGDPAWKIEHAYLYACQPFFHLPLDNRALMHLRVTYACPAIWVNRIHTQAAIQIGDERVTWSRLNDLGVYLQLQGFVQEALGTHLQVFENALHFSLSELSGPL